MTARHLVIADYSADWPDKFKSEAEQLARILGPRYTDCPAELRPLCCKSAADAKRRLVAESVNS